jgi:adenylate cyclase class IV
MSKEEKEIKIELKIPIEQFLKRARKLGYKNQKTITQTDNYFDTTDWKLYKSVASVRIRRVNGKDHSFAFKKVLNIPTRSNSHYVEEIEGAFPITRHDAVKDIFERLSIKCDDYTSIVNGEQLANVFLINGLQGEQVMSKVRRSLIDANKNEIVIDDIENVGTVVELECEDNEPLEVVKSLLDDDEWSRNITGTGYMWLEKVKGFNLHLKYPKRFSKDPDWNVWENEREMYDNMLKAQVKVL